MLLVGLCEPRVFYNETTIVISLRNEKNQYEQEFNPVKIQPHPFPSFPNKITIMKKALSRFL